ncbi:phosphatase PAP2 family protein [Actinokineospora soli]|uniref:Phosphatase PAP2 family protein n=1 Tax=Actinokineospora soli TaxID=1048753 RepID=A0ABW2TJP8_9PSEU
MGRPPARRPRLRGLLLRATVLLAACRAVSLAKPVFERARPREYPDFSFPSGHVVSVASVAFTLVVLCAWLAARRLRAVVWWSVAAVVLAALCRIVLDVHWLTDVLGASLGVVGLGLLTATGLGLLPARPGGVRSRA